MNALIDQLTALTLHGMAAFAHDLLSTRKPPSLTTAIKQLIDAETVERRVRSIQYQMRIAKLPHIRTSPPSITAQQPSPRPRSSPSARASSPKRHTTSSW
jgi:hypothetical protein